MLIYKYMNFLSYVYIILEFSVFVLNRPYAMKNEKRNNELNIDIICILVFLSKVMYTLIFKHLFR